MDSLACVKSGRFVKKKKNAFSKIPGFVWTRMRIQPYLLARRHQGRFAGESLSPASPAKRPWWRGGWEKTAVSAG